MEISNLSDAEFKTLVIRMLIWHCPLFLLSPHPHNQLVTKSYWYNIPDISQIQSHLLLTQF